MSLGDGIQNMRVRLSNLVHWANGVKENSLTGLSFLTKYGFTWQGNQIGNNYKSKMNGMNSNWMKAN